MPTYISVSIVKDSDMKILNKKYRNKDYSTDVLSFNMDTKQEDGSYYLGDVVVNEDRAKKQAGEYGNSYEEEVAKLIEHGVLHLLGVHHKENE